MTQTLSFPTLVNWTLLAPLHVSRPTHCFFQLARQKSKPTLAPQTQFFSLAHPSKSFSLALKDHLLLGQDHPHDPIFTPKPHPLPKPHVISSGPQFPPLLSIPRDTSSPQGMSFPSRPMSMGMDTSKFIPFLFVIL
jgi:hypothetical protein